MLCGQYRVETARLGEASSLEKASSTVDVPPILSNQRTVRIETEQMYPGRYGCIKEETAMKTPQNAHYSNITGKLHTVFGIPSNGLSS